MRRALQLLSENLHLALYMLRSDETAHDMLWALCAPSANERTVCQ